MTDKGHRTSGSNKEGYQTKLYGFQNMTACTGMSTNIAKY